MNSAVKSVRESREKAVWWGMAVITTQSGVEAVSLEPRSPASAWATQRHRVKARRKGQKTKLV